MPSLRSAAALPTVKYSVSRSWGPEWEHASVVVLGERHRSAMIATLDHRHFFVVRPRPLHSSRDPEPQCSLLEIREFSRPTGTLVRWPCC
jgi:hypothetical protein